MLRKTFVNKLMEFLRLTEGVIFLTSLLMKNLGMNLGKSYDNSRESL